jgi:His/Glu/Gln/Arg/opine family amino acid ABC transporter permease subunit
MTFEPATFWSVLFSQNYLYGAGISLLVALIAQIFGTLIGFVLAAGRQSGSRPVRSVSWVYIWFFRALPTLLILLIVWNAMPQFFPSLNAPWFTPFVAACIGLAVTEGAYMAEIIRSARMSVDEGQGLAARALGMTPTQSMQRVLLPQMIRVAIPATGNEFINMIKYTSLASVIALQELLTRAQVGVATTFRYGEYYAAAAVYYLVIVSVLTVLQSRLERRYAWKSLGLKVSSGRSGAAVPQMAAGAGQDGVKVP